MSRVAVMLLLLSGSAAAEEKLWCFSPDGPWLHPVHDGYDWLGVHWLAHITRDGYVDFAPRRVRGDAGFSSDDEKRWFLEETEELRLDMGTAERERLVAHSLETLPRLLGWIWGDARWSIDERRRLLFAVWDEAAEPDDPELGRAGKKARIVINHFIQHNLPEGSPLGFSSGELAQLNLKRAKGPRFDPYHPPPDLDRP